jgi:small redox-active disulfide protein 2
MLNIKILGPGCQKCNVLLQRTQEVVSENNYEANISKIDDIMEIMQYNILSTPGLVINEKVVVKGMIPTKEEIKKHIEIQLNG